MKITLCGSARFEELFHLWNEILTLSGHTVYGLSVYPSNKNNEKSWYSKKEKKILDKVHLEKIKSSEGILVLNNCSYIGESTLREIEYAKKLNKKIFFLESWGKGNGIDGKFTEEARLVRKYWNATRSPIDTFGYNYLWDLLPPGGPFRSSLIDKKDKYEKREVLLAKIKNLEEEVNRKQLNSSNTQAKLGMYRNKLKEI